MPKPQLSELPFASLLVYSPRGAGDESRRSRSIVYTIKTEGTFHLAGGARIHASRYVARRMRELNVASEMMTGFWDADTTLVPIPRSSLQRQGSLWPSFNIANALVAEGLGARVARLLERVIAIPKAALAERGARPSYQDHIASLRVVPELIAPTRITLVDDVVTKGVAMLSAAHALAEAYPGVEIRGFAVVRTMGLQPDVDAVLAPCVGTICFREDVVVRTP